MSILWQMKKCPVPASTMLNTYSIKGAYTDCYRTEVPGRVPFPEFVFAFYTTSLFKLERSILKLTVAKPSTDIQARQLADGSLGQFAAWHVESRSENELLMRDFRGRTRSWLMVIPINITGAAQTRLYFGSAVVPVREPKTGRSSIGTTYQALLGFHKIYSILLLYSAKLSIQQRRQDLLGKQK